MAMAISYVPLMDAGMRTTKLAFGTWNLASTPATPRRRRATSVDIRARTENIANARAGFAVGGPTIGEARFGLETREGLAVSRRTRVDARVGVPSPRSRRWRIARVVHISSWRNSSNVFAARTGALSVFDTDAPPLATRALRGDSRARRVWMWACAMSSFTLSPTLRGVPPRPASRARSSAPRALLRDDPLRDASRSPEISSESLSRRQARRACDALPYIARGARAAS